MTLRFKIFFYFILPIICIVAILNIYNSKQEMAQVKDLSDDSFISNTKNASFAISKNSTSAITLLKASSKVLAKSLFGKRAESISYLESILQGFSDFSAISLAYEINADGNDEKTYNGLIELQQDPSRISPDFYDAYDSLNNDIINNIDAWVAETENGRFLMRLRRSGEKIALEPLYGIESRVHYTYIKNRYSNSGNENTYISEPSFENLNLYIEYIYPLVSNNKFVGELAFYKNIYYILNTLKTFIKIEDSHFFLLNNTGKVVANTIDMNIATSSIDDLYLDAENKFNSAFLYYKNGKLVRDETLALQTSFNSYSTLYRDALRLIVRGDNPEGSVIEYTDPKSKEEYLLCYIAIKELGWTLIQICPKQNLYTFKEKAEYNSLSELTVALISFFVMCIAFSYYTRRLKRTTKSIENIYEGKMHLQIPEIRQSKDESVKLINAIALLSSKVSAIVNQTKNTNSHLIDTAEKLTIVSNEYEHNTKNFDSFIGEISRSLNQITDTSKNIKDATESLSISLKQTSILAKEEKKLIENSFKTIEKLSENTLSLVNRVGLIKDRAKTALESLNNISKIISQANLLSINTSIEAKKSKERADTLSKISKEVSIIANLTKEYSKEIALVIRDLLESAFIAIEQTLKFNEEIVTLKNDFEKLIHSTENTSLSIENILPEVHKINDSMSSQNLRKAQLKETIILLENNSKQANILYRQFIDLRRELNFSIEQITHEISKFSAK